MAYRAKRRGMGTAADQYPALCGTWAVFKPQCWCLDHPWLCTAAQHQAALAAANPGVYAPIQAPPVVGAPVGNTPDPGSTDALIAAQNAAWKTQNMGVMQQTAQNLQDVVQSDCPGETLVLNSDGSYSCPPSSGIPWWVWALGALTLGLAVMPGPGYGGGRAL